DGWREMLLSASGWWLRKRSPPPPAKIPEILPRYAPESHSRNERQYPCEYVRRDGSGWHNRADLRLVGGYPVSPGCRRSLRNAPLPALIRVVCEALASATRLPARV